MSHFEMQLVTYKDTSYCLSKGYFQVEMMGGLLAARRRIHWQLSSLRDHSDHQGVHSFAYRAH
jgi:hypothetical protein